MTRDCISVIEGHVSIRRYKREPLPFHHLAMILEAGRRAPTDAALHLWTVVRVRDPVKRMLIARAIGQRHVEEAGEFLVFLADLYRLQRLLEHRGEQLGIVEEALLLFAAIDAGIAAENMALAAESLGYGICFIGAVWNDPILITGLLGLPPKTLPLFGLTIGIPAEKPEPRPRQPLESLVHTDHYRDYTRESLEDVYTVMATITRRRDYLRLLKRYAGKNGYFETRNTIIKRILQLQQLTQTK